MTAIEVTSPDPSRRRDLNAFIQFPKRLYAADPLWIAPLDLEQRETLGRKNPFFEHAHGRLWLAWRNGQVVGRIAAHVDQLYEQTHGEKVGWFGFFECEDQAEIAATLLDHAASWLRGQGCTRVRGPFNPSINGCCGLLIDGFDTPPYMMMPHTPPHYPALVAAAGFEPAQELLAYRLDLADPMPAATRRLVQRFQKRIELRSLAEFDRAKGFALMRDIFNDAWQHNWGFVPFTENEFNAMGKELTLVMDSRQAQLAFLDGRAVGMMATVPDINQAIRGLNGKLLPFGWFHFLKRLKGRGVNRVRVPLMGVRSELHGTSMAAGVAFCMLARAWDLSLEKGIVEAEMSWILKDNKPIRDVIERIGGKAYKRYHIYEKSLSS
ncbi:MAG: protein YghO [Wenzhouxiangellaceae bacterium]